MKAVIFAALIATAILLMGPAQAVTTTQYVEIDTVLMIYKHYDRYGDDVYTKDISAAEASEIETQAADAVALFWRASNFRCHMNIIDAIHIERELTNDQLHDYGIEGKYWLSFWRAAGQTTSVEDDLYDRGYVDGDISAVWVVYAWRNSPGSALLMGGGTYGPGTGCMGDAAYSCSPAYAENAGYFRHEGSHGVDALLKLSGYPDAMWNGDDPIGFNRLIDCGLDFEYKVLNEVLWAEWSGIYTQWATIQTVTDADGDGIPASGSLPITEATLGSSDTDTDSDDDGLSDFDETQARFWDMTDLGDTDTDNDGISDGSDAYPLTVLVNTSIKDGNPNQLTVDGLIKNGEKYKQVSNFNGTDADHSADIWVSHKADVLYIAVDVTDDILYVPTSIDWADFIAVQIDAEEDGYKVQGTSNYRLMVSPLDVDGKVNMKLKNYSSEGTYTMDTTGIDAEFTTSATGYIVEFSITEAALENSLQFNPGTDIRITFQLYDPDGFGTWTDFSWNMFSGIDYMINNAKEFVILSLTD